MGLFAVGLLLLYFVIASAETKTQIRLVNGRTRYMGRIEVLFNGEWGTVCDDLFDENDALVVCRMLGFNNIERAIVHGKAYYGQGNGTVVVTDLQCNGDETDIKQCPSNVWGESKCRHWEDVGVNCQTPVQLVGGPTTHAGQIEITYQGSQRRVCGESFGENDADVVCRMLGFSTGNVAIDTTGMYGGQSGYNAITDLKCKGKEFDVTECNNSSLSVDYCNSYTVGLDCRTNIRLVGGETDQSGRVEIYYNDEWGTVCDDSFDDNDASVICRMLGFNPINAKAYGRAYFGGGHGGIIVDELECKGSETDILQCKSNIWQSPTNCDHKEDAGVECLTEIRLVDGPTPFSGRLEMHKQDMWNIFCDETFDNYTAAVACNMLGYERGNISIHTEAYYGEGKGEVTDYDLSCFGNETDIVQCGRNDREQNCTSRNAIGINCFSVTPIRLVGGFKSPSGKVEIFYNSSWLSVCNQIYGFTVQDAQVICRMLGSPNTTPSIHVAQNLYDFTIRDNGIADLNCKGSESDLSNCRSNIKWGQRNCSYHYSVGINCDPVTPLRLVDGPSKRAGRVEVLYNGTWGSVCDRNFNATDGNVICRMLGYHDGSMVLQKTDFLTGNGSIIVSDLNCTGYEDDISNCKASKWLSTPYCSHNRDVGVACKTKVRIVNGTNVRSGRVEVYHNGTWGTICADAFDRNVADVVCRMAGFRFWNTTVLPGSTFGSGTGDVLIDQINCTGSEADITECYSQPWQQTNCTDNSVASINCHIQVTPMRLVDVQYTPHSGHVEVLHNNKWGTICSYGFTKANTDVVCRTLGYAFSSDATWRSEYGNTYNVMISNLNCDGTETDISECPSDLWDSGYRRCTKSNYHNVRVNCLTSIKLAYGRTSYMGRVDVQHNNGWGAVCDNQFTESNGHVVCSMLGYNFTRNVQVMSNIFPHLYSNVILDGLNCTGDEHDVQQCRSYTWNDNNCTQDKAVGINCNTPVRLVNGTSARVGVMQVMFNSSWGSVCASTSSNENKYTSQVVCRMLGYSFSQIDVFSPNETGNATQEGYSLTCNGNEKDVSECKINQTECLLTDMIGIRCNTPLILTGGRTRYMGQIQLELASGTGGIKYNRLGDNDANTVCNMLGFNFTSFAMAQSVDYLNQKRYQTIIVDQINCVGNESDIADCIPNFESWVYRSNTTYSVNINCQTPLRLVDGIKHKYGRVEIYYNYSWKSVCSQQFKQEDAFVLCRMLGHYHTGNATVLRGNANGLESSKFLRGDFQCAGQEDDISQCDNVTWSEDTCEDGSALQVDCRSSIRLVDGPSEYEGRVEVYYNGSWSPVCSDSVSSDNAKVMCRMLGQNDYNPVIKSGSYNWNGTFSVTSMRCVGVEAEITECPSNDWLVSPCYTNKPVELACYTPVYLKGGSNQYTGRVEFAYQGGSRGICADNFDKADLEFVCRNTGYYKPNMTMKISERTYSSVSGWIEELNCLGNETDLQACNSSAWAESSSHCRPAAANCRANTPVRLMDGPNNSSGRVEVFYSDAWGTVCDDNFDDADATVICHMMGFKVGTTGTDRISGSGRIIIDGIKCVGTEFDASECPSNTWLYHNCGHNEDVSVHCTNTRVRLLDGLNVNKGRVDVQFQGRWRSVCVADFDLNDAEVVCRELGFSSQKNATLYQSGKDGYASTIINDLQCAGNETDVDQCASFPWSGSTYCPRVGINCRPNTPVRLVAGPNRYSGRVEVEYLGWWGTICDYEFDIQDAMVICRMLGYNTRSVGVRLRSFYGEGSGNITISHARCTGSEPDISECSGSYNWLSPYAYCDHGRDASVQCNTPVRLSGGWTPYSGRVEVYYDNRWGSVCDQDFDLDDAAVICKLLGYRKDDNETISVHPGAYYGRGEGDVIIQNLNCSGTEGDLYECQSPEWSTSTCEHEQDVGINCRAKTDVRLMNRDREVTTDPTKVKYAKGRVEVNHRGEWGTICNDHFDDDDALVLCTMMGYTSGALLDENFNIDTKLGDIIIDDLNCLGIESDISECRASEWTVHDCTHEEDVAIECSYQENIDPCDPLHHKPFPYLDFRYVNFMTEHLNTRLNDSRLPLRWYNVEHNSMPDTPPKVFSCGTQYPIYVNGPSPYAHDGLVNRTACQIGTNSTCVNSYDIQVKQCPQQVFVYKLGPTLNEQSGYCFGTGKEGNAPSHVPGGVSIDVKIYEAVTFVCQFDTVTEDLFYQVYWDIQGDRQLTITKGYCNRSNITLLHLEQSELEENKIAIGFDITCAVRAYTEPRGRPGRRSATSKPFFAGIRIDTPSMTMARGETKAIELVLTVPVQCKKYDCNLRLVSSTPYDGDCNNNGLAFGECGVSIPKDSVGLTQRLGITTAETGQYGVSGNFKVFLQVDNSDNYPLWKGYKLPVIEIEIVPETNKKWRGTICAARNDPHMYTFDGRQYEHHEDGGVYTMYKNSKYPDVEIQHKVTHCTTASNPAMCNCGVAVRAGRDVYVISVCDGLWDIGYKHCGDNALSVKKENDMTYTIYLPYGTAMRARIDSQPWMGPEGGKAIDISIQPSLHDQDGQSRGLCGTLDGDKDNDFHSVNEDGEVVSMTERTAFIKNWIVENEFSMFTKQVYNLDLKPWLFPVCVCNSDDSLLTGELPCESSTNTCTPGVKTGTHSCHDVSGRRSVRSLTRKPRIPTVRISQEYTDHARFKRSTHDTIWTETSAKIFCNNYMEQSKTFALCQKVPSTHTGISIDNCIKDIMLTNSSEWSSLSLQSMQDSCLTEVFKNKTVREEVAKNSSTSDDGDDPDASDSIAEVVETIVKEIEASCPHNCNDRGNCSNGTCECDDGFGAYDCSLSITRPPRIDGLLDFGLCDESHSDCDHAFAFGEIFLEANLTCLLKEHSIDINGDVMSSRVEQLSGSTESLMEAVCPLHLMRPKRSTSPSESAPFVTHYGISISNDGTNFGNEKFLFVYDSTCQTYSNVSDDNSTQLEFSLKPGFCFIDRKCFENGTAVYWDDSLVCLSEMSSTSWTDISTTTTILPSTSSGNRRETVIELRLDFTINSTDDLSDNQTYRMYETEAKRVLKQHYTNEYFIDVIITSITQGSLIIKHKVVYQDDSMAEQALANALSEWLHGGEITLFNVKSTVLNLVIEDDEHSDKLLCEAYTAVSKCDNGATCVVENNVPFCRWETISAVGNQRETMIELRLDFKINSTDNLNDTRIYRKFETEAKLVLEQHYRHSLGDGLVGVNIQSITEGSLIIQHGVISQDDSSVDEALSHALTEWLHGGKITLFNVKTNVLNVVIGDKDDEHSDKLLCEAYTAVTKCDNGATCVVENNVPFCRWETISAVGNQRETMIKLRLDFKINSTDNLNDTRIYRKFEKEAKIVLEQHYRHSLGDGLVGVNIQSITEGSLIIQHGVVSQDDSFVDETLSHALTEWLHGGKITLFNVKTTVLNVVIGEKDGEYSDKLLCAAYTAVTKCDDDATCVMEDKSPVCRKRVSDDSANSLMLKIWIPVTSGLVLIIIIIVVWKCMCTDKTKYPTMPSAISLADMSIDKFRNADPFNKPKSFDPVDVNRDSPSEGSYSGLWQDQGQMLPRLGRNGRHNESNFYSVPGDTDSVFYGVKRQ